MHEICEALFPGMHVMTPKFPLTYLEWDVGHLNQVLDAHCDPIPSPTRLADRIRPRWCC